MTDRIHSFIVVLDKDIRDDDLQPVLEAIKMIKHVIKVKPNISDISDIVAYSRVKQDFVQKLSNLIRDLAD